MSIERKRDIRRHFKRADKARSLRFELQAEAEAEASLQRELDADDARFREETDPRILAREQQDFEYYQQLMADLNDPWYDESDRW
mgnify:CR=1 FL=1